MLHELLVTVSSYIQYFVLDKNTVRRFCLSYVPNFLGSRYNKFKQIFRFWYSTKHMAIYELWKAPNPHVYRYKKKWNSYAGVNMRVNKFSHVKHSAKQKNKVIQSKCIKKQQPGAYVCIVYMWRMKNIKNKNSVHKTWRQQQKKSKKPIFFSWRIELRLLKLKYMQ